MSFLENDRVFLTSLEQRCLSVQLNLSMSERAVKSFNVRCFTRLFADGSMLFVRDDIGVHKEVVSMIEGFFLMTLVV
jgi:hypothetical protein